MPSSIQIIVVGVMGASTAYHLAPRDCTDVLLLEKQKLFGIGATGICDGGVRCQFSTEINIRLSQLSLQHAGVEPIDLSLILLTHGHGDHAGSANELAVLSGAPIAIHAADDGMARAGRNVLGTLNGLEARMIAPFVDKPFPPVAALQLIDDDFDLRSFGVDGRVFATPGHTPGSISILLDSGDAIVGDLLMGGRMGGALWSSQPRLHYFVGDFAQLHRSMEVVLDQHPQRLLVGHGGPLDATAVHRWWEGSANRQVAAKRAAPVK